MGEDERLTDMLNDDLKARFDAEIQGHPVVLYMKGNALFPQCGFSARALEALKRFGPVHTVDVLQDQAVREGIKQANGSMMAEPTMDVAHVANAIVHIADLPLDVNVQFMTVMATKMPFVGRG